MIANACATAGLECRGRTETPLAGQSIPSVACIGRPGLLLPLFTLLRSHAPVLSHTPIMSVLAILHQPSPPSLSPAVCTDLLLSLVS